MKAQHAYSQVGQSLSLAHMPSSVLAEHAWSNVSPNYKFLSTAKVLEAMADIGLNPYMVKQSGTRIEGKDGYTKHLVRLRSTGISPLKGNVYPEVVLVNSHDRASSFIIELGLFRLVCSNGLVVSFGSFGKYRLRHVASSISDVLLAAHAIVEQFPMIEERVLRMQSIELTNAQRYDLASKAILLRWDAESMPYDPIRLLQSQRMADDRNDLWTTFNVIQENLMRGQRVSRWGRFNQATPNRSTQAVKSIDVEMTVNRGLWELADTFSAS